jgi:cytochrome P450
VTLRSMRGVPGPRSVAAHWDLYRRRYRYGEVLHELWTRYGDVVRVPFPGRDIVLLAHPDEIHAVLASKAHYFRIFGQDMLRRITPWGLVATEGQVHDENRARMMLAMRKILARCVPEMAARACRHRLAMLQDGDTIDVGSLARDVTLGVAMAILYPATDDTPPTRPDEGEFAARLSRSSAWLLGLPLPLQWGAFAIDTRGTLRALGFQRKFRRQVGEAIQRARSRTVAEAPGDMLSLLVHGSETGGPMPEEFLADNILNLLLAAYETSGNALAWAIWEASGRPAIQARIAEEGGTMPDDPGAHESWMNDAHWIDATLRETLRLYPSVWTLCRQALADYRVGEWLFPRGTVFMASQWVTQRDPRWFANPFRFAPERWEEERAALAAGGSSNPKRPQFASFPFGAGNRFCIGKATFEFEGSMLLAAFFRDWIAEPVAECRPRPRFYATMRPDSPMMVRLRRR